MLPCYHVLLMEVKMTAADADLMATEPYVPVSQTTCFAPVFFIILCHIPSFHFAPFGRCEVREMESERKTECMQECETDEKPDPSYKCDISKINPDCDCIAPCSNESDAFFKFKLFMLHNFSTSSDDATSNTSETPGRIFTVNTQRREDHSTALFMSINHSNQKCRNTLSDAHTYTHTHHMIFSAHVRLL